MSSCPTEKEDVVRRDDTVYRDARNPADKDVPELPVPERPPPGLETIEDKQRDEFGDARTIQGDDENIAKEEKADVQSLGDGEIAIRDWPAPPSTPVRDASASVPKSRYRELLEEQQQDSASDDGSTLGLPRRPGSPGGDSIISIPDSSASNRNSMISSFGGSSVFRSSGGLSRFGLRGASPSFRPFDQRFQSRIVSSGSVGSPLASPTGRPSSPGLLALTAHNRSGSSHSSSFQYPQTDLSSASFVLGGSTETPSPPWEVMRWTKLTKLSGQSFSESAKRNFGSPTCMAISQSIVIGTTKGVMLVFDYNQNLKTIIGMGTKAVEAGAITSVSISADHTTVAGGHADGSIFTWDLGRSSRPFLHIPPMDAAQVENQQRIASGHMPGFSVTHLGFLGSRRTALVSADDRGMAFAHLATRGTGSLGRTVKTSRILGRYPGAKLPVTGKPIKPIKPSTVLAFAPLPLGNFDRATDSMGLTAMLTPYLLVIVSTTPVANTQHKSPRPKEVAPHSAMSGCLAWFPAVRLKVPDPRTGDEISLAKLVYCWSNVLTVLDVEEIPSEDPEKQPTLHCKARNRWKCEESIVAVQWLTRSVLAVLTISQRLIVLEEYSMRVTEAFDLLSRYIYHSDLFSRQLQNVVETLDEEDTSLHGVVADAFYMSFKAYKSRLFLLGFNDVAIGALSNWADRLIALMEQGDYVGAIQLATRFYTGDADKHTIGLPDDTATRHAMVQERLMEIMTASLKYAFGQRQKTHQAVDDSHLLELAQTCFTACERVGNTEFVFDEMYEWFEETGTECMFLETLEPYILERTITAVPPTVVKALVRHYVNRGMESRLEEIICHMDTATLDLDQITTLCKQHGLYDALIYVWNQAMRDFITPLIDLLALLVPHMPNGEYEAPENVTDEQDMHDTNALKIFPYLSYVLTGRIYPTGETMDDATQQQAKSEIYWFLFSGKSVTWPRSGSLSKRFLTRPNQSQEPSFPYLRMILKFHAPSFLSALNEAFEDSFLNDSPEKQLVNGSTARNLPEEQVFGLTVHRQYILSILIEIMNPSDFAPEDTIYLDMFIARNLPKYPQYLLIPESTLTKVLIGLCHYPGADLEEDAQLSAEYLLSVYHPPDMADLIPQFKTAGFYRILKQTYHADKQYGKLLQTYFEDPKDKQGVFSCIAQCLRVKPGKQDEDFENDSLLRRQIQEVHSVILSHAFELVELDPPEAARKLEEYAPAMHSQILGSIEARQDLQYTYLKVILEAVSPDGTGTEALDQKHQDRGVNDRRRSKKQDRDRPAESRRDLIEQYIRLMCKFDPAHVSEYVGIVQTAHLRLDTLLPTMEETGVVDAAVVLLAQDGQVQDAMIRLIQHLHTLESAVQGLLSADPAASSGNASVDPYEDVNVAKADARRDSRASNATINQLDTTEELMRALQRYTHVGIWLCQRQTDTSSRRPGGALSRAVSSRQLVKPHVPDGLGDEHDEANLTIDEKLWLDLISATVQITRNLSAQVHDLLGKNKVTADPSDGAESDPVVADTDADKLTSLLRSLVQHTFTALLTATSSGAAQPPTPSPNGESRRHNSTIGGVVNNASFLRILKAFLARAAVSSPSLADLRAVLGSIFAAYAYEESILRLSNRLLERSLFVSVQRSAELRQRGWRAKGSTCEACGRRVWGPGVYQQGGTGRANGGGGGLSIYEAWEAKQAAEMERRSEKKRALLMVSRGRPDRGKGKDYDEAGSGGGGGGGGKGNERLAPPFLRSEAGRRTPSPRPMGVAGDHQIANDTTKIADGRVLAVPGSGGLDTELADGGLRSPSAAAMGPLVVFACRHIYHQSCLDALEVAQANGGVDGSVSPSGLGISGIGDNRMLPKRRQHGERDRDYVCPIDG